MFVAYHKETTKILRMIRNGFWQDAMYETKGACTRAINKATNEKRIVASDYAVLPIQQYRKIEKTEVVKNLMTGLEVTQSVNTPACCDVSTETYCTR